MKICLPSLVEENDKDNVIPKGSKSMHPWNRSDQECKQIINECIECFVPANSEIHSNESIEKGISIISFHLGITICFLKASKRYVKETLKK